MTRFQFIAELRARLVALTNEERESAIKYYEEYFDDAGEEKEQEVIKNLVSPEKIAKQILSDYNKKEKASSEFVPLDPNNPVEQETEDEKPKPVITPEPVRQKTQLSGGAIALIVILCIIFSPVLIGLFFGAVGILIGIISTVFGLYIAFACVVFAFIVSGIACGVFGIVTVFSQPTLGLGIIGAGLLVGGLGLFLVVPFKWVTIKAIPAICRWFVKVIAWPFKRLSGRV